MVVEEAAPTLAVEGERVGETDGENVGAYVGDSGAARGAPTELTRLAQEGSSARAIVLNPERIAGN